MRFAYVLVTYLVSPLYALYWIFRGVANRSYWDRLGQRLGLGYPLLSEGTIWIHAVSVGEVQATVPLVGALQQRFPDRRLLVTTVTPTGAARVRGLFGDEVAHCYIPFEIPPAVRNFFRSIKPDLALIMETEIWPNLYDACGKREIPLMLVSARISPQAVNRYRRFLPLFRETLSHGIIIAAQSETDADRFRSLGAAPERTWVTGNIKFDFELPPDLEADAATFREQNFAGRPVWIAASTHDKEEEQVLSAHLQLLDAIPDALLILVPRHPERFGTVEALLRRKRFKYISRTKGRPCPDDANVFLGDTMGELQMFYAASDIAFVGGTLVPIGGHNLLEPAALGMPVVTGPHLFNAQDIADMFIEVGACVRVRDSDELAASVRALFVDRDEAARIGSRGREIVSENRGALRRLLNLMG
ncbi:MAG: lipid IV(A) 3-deoxy-D-manno-octulosonic acid transferase, partial [Woeseia sp.]